MNDNRSEKIKTRLIDMCGFAEERKQHMESGQTALHEDWYIRIGGNGFCAVSVNENTPLKGFKKNGSGVKDIKTILAHFRDGSPEKPARPVPERQIQSFIIKSAIKNKLDLSPVLSLDKAVYDRLLFALDEVSIGDSYHKPIVRCDILAIGVKDDKAIPVLIELKSSRDQTRLTQQLDNFCEQIIKFRKEFAELLSKCSGLEVYIPDKAELFGKMIIWPENIQARKQTIPDFHSKKTDVLEYSWDGNDVSTLNFTECRYHNQG